MKKFISSNLNFGCDPQNDESVRILATCVAAQGQSEDVLVLAGNHATDDDRLRECLALFDGFKGLRLAVSGDRDVRVRSPLETSAERMGILMGTYQEMGFHPLDESPILAGGIAFAGTIGWYDHSFRDAGLGIPIDAYLRKAYPSDETPVPEDLPFTSWGSSDFDVTRDLAERLENHLRQASVAARETVVVTYHAPTKRLLPVPHFLQPAKTRFAYSFQGSDAFSGIIERYARGPAIAVCGNLDVGRAIRLNNVHYASVGSTSAKKQLIVSDRGGISRFSFSC